MSGPDYTSAQTTVDYGAASELFPVEELETSVFQYRDADCALDRADADEIVVVAPTGFASAMCPGQHTLTAIPIADLPAEIRSDIDRAVDDPIETLKFVQIGDRPSDSPDRSLAEFMDT